MSKLIVICGLPGSGKTTLASELSRRLNIFCLHKDSVKESLFESLKLSTLEDSKKIGYPAVKVALDLVEENIGRGIDVILESPFNFPEEGKLFEEWKEKYHIDFFAVILQVGPEERRRRFVERERHRAHHDTDRLRMTGNTLEETCSYDHIPEKKLFLETNKPVEALVEKVMEFLRS
ncbi:MAG: ATP-binding protein [Candidatus Moraniibacteriota bacterium]